MPQWAATGQEMALRKHLIAGKFRIGLGDTQLTLSRLGLRACFDVTSPTTHCMKFTGDRIPLDLTCLLHHLCALVRKRGHVESGVFRGITMLRTNRTGAARLSAGLRAGLSFGTIVLLW